MNAEKAVYWYKEAANKGNAEAQLAIGLCYAEGIGITKDMEQAAFWLRMAAERGELQTAQYALGMCYLMGDGVPKNNKKRYIGFVKQRKIILTQKLCWKN